MVFSHDLFRYFPLFPGLLPILGLRGGRPSHLLACKSAFVMPIAFRSATRSLLGNSLADIIIPRLVFIDTSMS